MPHKNLADRRANFRRFYELNKEKVKASVREHKKKLKAKMRNHIAEHLSQNPCKDCGEIDPIVLEFDHLRDKKFNIGDAVRKNHSFKALVEEIAKCEVRCANCHRRKTYREQREKFRLTVSNDDEPLSGGVEKSGISSRP